MATVLVVDDHPANRHLTRDLLGYRGHRVIEAADGEQALQLVHAQHPDLVLTDVLMPGIDGYQLAQEIRSADDTADIPIIFLTANYLPEEARPFAEACGVDKVLLKSAAPPELLQSVDDVLSAGHAPHNLVDTERAQSAHVRAVADKLAETKRSLLDTEQRFRVIAEHAPVGIVFGDEHGAAQYVNTRFAAIMGAHADELLGRGWLMCVNPDLTDVLLEIIAGAANRPAQHRHREQVQRPDGAPVWLDVHLRTLQHDEGAPNGFICLVDDITVATETERARREAEHRRQADERAGSAERLQSLSNLAGGVAHDFNNILGAILGYETLLNETIQDLNTQGTLDDSTTQGILADLRNIRTGGERATGLTQQLLTFGSRKLATAEPLDLNAAVHETTRLLTASLGPQIGVITYLDPDLRAVQANPDNVGQVVLNLVLNARDAMPDGGTLTIATRNLDTTDEPVLPPDLPPGRYARFSVGDTGQGMTPEVLRRAVEPFFTTKARGQGAGLGLATVYGIVNQLGGLLQINSVPHQGTTVVIHLPVTDSPAQTPTQQSADPAGGNETILVVDDEDGVRDITARILTRAGYHVLTATDGPNALAVAAVVAGQQHAPIDLILTDVVMPGMLGTELVQLLLPEHPATKALLMSGYAGEIMTDRGTLHTDLPILAKPFTEAELLSAVRAQLSIKPRSP
jgi:PAS domain S-box-containing protein